MSNESLDYNQIASKASEYLIPGPLDELKDSEDDLLNQAASMWVDIASDISPTRPTLREIKDYLKDVVKDVVKEIVTKNKDVTVVTLSFVTEQLVNYLIITLGWQTLTPFLIPLEILAAIIYSSVLKEIKKRL